MKNWRFWIAASVTFFGDLITKYFLFHAKVSFSFFSGIIRSTKHQNFGLITNLPAPQAVILFVSLLAIVLLFYLAHKSDRPGRLFALGMILGGALGNFFDRASLGYVRDWLLLFDRSAINLADASIALGLIFFAFSFKKPPASQTLVDQPDR